MYHGCQGVPEEKWRCLLTANGPVMPLELLEPRFLLLYVYVTAALYVHLRGQVRFPLHKQDTSPVALQSFS